MSGPLQTLLQLHVKLWQALLFTIAIVLFTGFTTYSISREASDFQYNNLQRQQRLVDRSVTPIEQSVRDLRERVVEAEFNVDFQVKESKRTLDSLNELIYKANPKVLAEMARRDFERTTPKSINQQANPTINVNPVINNTGK